MKTEDQEMINRIANDVVQIIYRYIRKQDSRNAELELQIEAYIGNIENEIEHIEELIQDYTEENLTFNRIEQEGYLRCLKTQYNTLNDIIKSIEKQEES